MALFNAENLMSPEDDEHEFILEGFKDQGVSVPLLLVIAVSGEIREIAKKARKKYNNARYITRGDRTETKPMVDPYQYCVMILQKAYISSSGDVFDTHNKDVLFALLRRFPAFAKLTAEKLYDFFQSGENFKAQEDEEDEKN